MAKVLVLTQFFPPETFAGANRVGSMVEALAKTHEVVVLTLLPSYPAPSVYPPRAAAEHDRGRRYRTHRRFRFTAHSSSVAARAVREQVMALRLGVRAIREPADVIISSTPSMFLGPVCLALARMKSCPFVWDVRDVGWEYAGDTTLVPARLEPALKLLQRSMWFAASRADVVVAATPGIAALLGGRLPSPERVLLVGNSVSAELIEACEVCGEHVEKDRPLVSYVGLIGDAQGLDVLPAVARSLPAVDLRVVGDGPERARLKQLIAEQNVTNLQLTGYLPREEVLETYRQSDVLFAQLKDTPTLNSTGLPSKLHEYMATGKPLVYAGRGLAAETVERIGSGLTAEPGSAESIVAAIRWLLASPEAGAEMGARGRAFVIDGGDRESKFGELLARLDDELRQRR